MNDTSYELITKLLNDGLNIFRYTDRVKRVKPIFFVLVLKERRVWGTVTTGTLLIFKLDEITETLTGLLTTNSLRHFSSSYYLFCCKN